MEDTVVSIPIVFETYSCRACLDTYLRWTLRGTYWCGECFKSVILSMAWRNGDWDLENALREFSILKSCKKFDIGSFLAGQKVLYNFRVAGLI